MTLTSIGWRSINCGTCRDAENFALPEAVLRFTPFTGHCGRHQLGHGCPCFIPCMPPLHPSRCGGGSIVPAYGFGQLSKTASVLASRLPLKN
jgi:hypothetical protein